jgi:hypothetical protein
MREASWLPGAIARSIAPEKAAIARTVRSVVNRFLFMSS